MNQSNGANYSINQQGFGPYFGSPWQQQSSWAPWGQWAPQWPMPPPCSYPSTSWVARPPSHIPTPRSSGPDILGTCLQAHSVMAVPSSYFPTGIEAPMNALSFSQPDGNYYMDTVIYRRRISYDCGSRCSLFLC